ncbi:MAG: AraC family transcriptional regulator [Lachnospiraceae bacterium]|nr:AraC family transcriptional regulator [Lachnospiraceae bacterium]
MAKNKKKMEFRYYEIPKGEYILPKLGKGWEQEYGVGYGSMQHFHNYMEVGYCYHGKGRLIIEDRIYRYSDQMFTIIPANVPHTTISDPGNICKWEFLFIDADLFIRDHMSEMFDIGGVDKVIRDINSRGTLKTRENHPIAAQIILSIIRECRKEDIYFKESVKGYLYSLFIEVLRLKDERERIISNGAKVDRFVRDAIEYVGAHYAEEIRVSDLASVCGLSESHFRRTFEESMNMKPNEYINLVRIDKACELLEKERIQIEDIAYKVGYQTPSTFNRNFKNLTGTSPLKWREQGRDKSSKREEFLISAQRGWEGLDKDGKQKR